MPAKALRLKLSAKLMEFLQYLQEQLLGKLLRQDVYKRQVLKYLSADVSAALKLHVLSTIMKELFRCRLFVQTLITVSGKPTPHTVKSV